MAGSIAAAFAFMADITSEEDRVKGMGLFGAAFGLGFIAGPAIGGPSLEQILALLTSPLPCYAAARIFRNSSLPGYIYPPRVSCT